MIVGDWKMKMWCTTLIVVVHMSCMNVYVYSMYTIKTVESFGSN